MLQEAKQQTGARCLLMEANYLGLRAESFDVALSTFILQHVPDPERVFREVLRTLRPGGVIGLASWGAKDNMPASAIWVEELDREGADEDPRPDENYRELVDAPDKVEQLLHAAGFDSIRSWAEMGHIPWGRDDLMSSQATVCAPSRCLRTLSPEHQAACAARVRRRVEALSDDELTYRPEVILSVARRPA